MIHLLLPYAVAAALDSGAADPAEVTAQRAPARPARVIRRSPAGAPE